MYYTYIGLTKYSTQEKISIHTIARISVLFNEKISEKYRFDSHKVFYNICCCYYYYYTIDQALTCRAICLA